MKQSKTVLLGEAIASLWDDDPDMYEQLLVHRLRDYLPELLGPMYRWLQEVRFDEGVLRLQVSSSAVRQELGSSKPSSSARSTATLVPSSCASFRFY